eukprot:XP_008660867.1 vegetative cell wall protein gp1-like [Zea mays]
MAQPWRARATPASAVGWPGLAGLGATAPGPGIPPPGPTSPAAARSPACPTRPLPAQLPGPPRSLRSGRRGAVWRVRPCSWRLACLPDLVSLSHSTSPPTGTAPSTPASPLTVSPSLLFPSPLPSFPPYVAPFGPARPGSVTPARRARLVPGLARPWRIRGARARPGPPVLAAPFPASRPRPSRPWRGHGVPARPLLRPRRSPARPSPAPAPGPSILPPRPDLARRCAQPGLGTACPRGLARSAAPCPAPFGPSLRSGRRGAAWRVRPYPWRPACSPDVRAPASCAPTRL